MQEPEASIRPNEEITITHRIVTLHVLGNFSRAEALHFDVTHQITKVYKYAHTNTLKIKINFFIF